MGFEHVMTPVVKIRNSIRSRAKQLRTFKVLLEELPAEYGDLLLHTEIRWLSRGRILLPFLSLLSEIKEFMQSRGEDAALLEDTDWTLDLAFLTDITGKRNSLNWELQGKVPLTVGRSDRKGLTGEEADDVAEQTGDEQQRSRGQAEKSKPGEQQTGTRNAEAEVVVRGRKQVGCPGNRRGRQNEDRQGR
ncbi:Zinc finger BED domain-containing protein 5 [Takifugu flavidus]|uniref:Zinc finger BED domain-containing protein 5 n=1 Tax=Takifugu flavidus TaxID=433684 RepID=A0A5C6N2F3_9TELE|nr:Zinc finger BED domain-containing protein 5 [Takifugu flavidus]